MTALFTLPARSILKFSITVLASNLRHIVFDVGVAGAVGEVELDQLSGADIVDPGKAETFERMMDRLALRIEHAGLEGDENAGFHERADSLA